MPDKPNRTQLLFHEKLVLSSGLMREIKIWQLPRSSRYPEGVKYSLVLVGPLSSKIYVLYDNHWPKGHHVHREDKEGVYEFINMATLISDFQRESAHAERKYRENKED